ncbi:MAG: glycosyl hydrolase family 28 protein [Mucilaginibacter sp.]|uniref:glycosyl hydrolase family 28 protein n=1 Tax=Mucilaginibacter sp. TaxID=1882438 RepID=UPI0032655D80
MRKIFFLLLFSFSTLYLFANIKIYPAPAQSELNNAFTVKVRQNGGQWLSVDVYLARVANTIGGTIKQEMSSFAYFDFRGEVEVSITSNKIPVKSVSLRPLSFGIKPTIAGNTILFKLQSPKNLSLEVNGNIFNNIHLFTNLPDDFVHNASDSNLVYFGPGIHRIGALRVASGKMVYIAGGAIVQGQLIMDKVNHIKITGRGILTQLPLAGDVVSGGNKPGRKLNRMRGDGITINYSKDIEVNGIILLPHKYSVSIGQSSGVTLKNLRSFSSEGNADGIDIFCSKNILIDSVFMRNSDDCIAIYGHRWSFFGNTNKIRVSNSILWADLAHPVLIGTHGDSLHPDTLSDITFKNIEVLDQHENQIDYQGCLALNAGDSNLIDRVSFTDINIENIRKGQLVNLRVMFNRKYNTSPGNAIQNILFKNISYKGTHANLSVISGYDDTRKIKNVVFENLCINGKMISDHMAGKPGFYKTGDMANMMIGEHTEDIKFVVSQ